MPFFLRRRDRTVTEIMDGEVCDPRKAAVTYRQFRLLNAVLFRPAHIYERWLKPRLSANPEYLHTLLDIGFGGGDIACALARKATAEGVRLHVTGIEINPRALDYVVNQPRPGNVVFRLARAEELLAQGERFDFVLSNHLLHHLAEAELGFMLETAARLARRLALMSDLQRSDLAWLGALLTLPFLHGSYHFHDGLASLRRAYTCAELRRLAPADWDLDKTFPSRLLLWHEPDPVKYRNYP